MSTKKKTHESSHVHRASTNQTLSNQTRRRDCKPTRGNNTLRLPRGRNGTAEKPPCIRVAACLVSCPRAVPAHLRERRLQFDPKPLVLPPEGEVLKAKVTDRAGGTRLA